MSKDMSPRELPARLCLSGRWFTREELSEMIETCESLGGLSRLELAQTLCEHFDWRRPNGTNKREACLKALEKLSSMELVRLRPLRRRKQQRRRPFSDAYRAEGAPIEGSVGSLEPLRILPVRSVEEMERWKAQVDQWHYLGYKRGFGARLYYFIWSERYPDEPLGCFLYASSAWRLACRDQWIGWCQDDRRQRLYLVVNQSRFLVFPWVRVKNLASRVQSISLKQLRSDWRKRYEYEPVLAEAFVDSERYSGASYRASNWTYLGRSKGSSRTSRKSDPPGSCKDVFVYVLDSDFREILCGTGSAP